MTLTYPSVHEPIGMVLTAEQYDALPPNPQRELVNGVVRMMAAPTFWHQDVARRLTNVLDACGRPNHRASGPIEIRLADDLRRNPDVVVVRAEHYERGRSRVLPSEVVLAVEVVSRGSESDDRREKPAEYSDAGIEHYWRVEIDPEIVVHTFRRGDAGYVETGVWTTGDTTNAPGLLWAQVKIADLDD